MFKCHSNKSPASSKAVSVGPTKNSSHQSDSKKKSFFFSVSGGKGNTSVKFMRRLTQPYVRPLSLRMTVWASVVCQRCEQKLLYCPCTLVS